MTPPAFDSSIAVPPSPPSPPLDGESGGVRIHIGTLSTGSSVATEHRRLTLDFEARDSARGNAAAAATAVAAAADRDARLSLKGATLATGSAVAAGNVDLLANPNGPAVRMLNGSAASPAAAATAGVINDSA
ncbi:hypothetical protein OJJOAM_003910 [Cupriavidus sp. H18C1]|uniref:hypothetical protein n=1 Tax=Cupriavidus sp. H18C1 TaxID=3241601 RepID=UPI003BB9A54D